MMAKFGFRETYTRVAGALNTAQEIMVRERGSVEWPWFVLNVCDSEICLQRLGLLRSDFSRFFWYLIARQWADFDAIPHDRLAEEFKKHRAGWVPEIMTWGHPKGTDNLKTYTNLPDSVTAYRGQRLGQTVGLSWTLDLNVAARFAFGRRDTPNPSPLILSRNVARKDIAFVVNEREESELVLFAPPKRDLCEIVTNDVAGLVEAR
jgi:hypothetical protein